MTTRIVIGCSTWRDYNFLLPITALLWREVIRHEPYLMLTGDWNSQRRSRVAATALVAHGFEFVALPAASGYDEATLAQNCRQHAAAMPFPEETWLVPSDADLWPIRDSWYQQHEGAHPYKAVAYYANGDHYQSLPTCHVAMRAKTWRDTYGLRVDGDVSGQVARSLDAWKTESPMYAAAQDKGLAVWCSDQWMMTEKMRTSPVWAATKMVERSGHPPSDRLDRGAWPAVYTVGNFIDAHMPKAPEEGQNWPKVLALAERLLPRHAKWIAEYRERYVS